jgi:hypothetical protein
MIPQRWIEAYLRFLLRYRGTVTIVVTAFTLLFCFFSPECISTRTSSDFYPKYRTFSTRSASAGNRARAPSVASCRQRSRARTHQDLHRL